MARTIYTEREIEDLARRGAKELEVGDDVYFTDLAREKMEQLGIKPRRRGAGAPFPASPSGGEVGGATNTAPLSESERQQLFDLVRAGVLARLGPGVDTAMVDTIVRRVVSRL